MFVFRRYSILHAAVLYITGREVAFSIPPPLRDTRLQHEYGIVVRTVSVLFALPYRQTWTGFSPWIFWGSVSGGGGTVIFRRIYALCAVHRVRKEAEPWIPRVSGGRSGHVGTVWPSDPCGQFER